MLSLLRRLAGHSPGGQGKSNQRPNAPQSVEIDGVVSFPFAAHLTQHEGFPIPDWTSINRWLEALHDDVRPQAWEACERAWLLHMRDALGGGYDLDEGSTAMLLSSVDERTSRYTLEFIERTQKRILRVLDGIAVVSPWGKDLLIVFDDHESYYRYAAHCYPEKGEFAFSSGMRISQGGCSHYITRKDDLRAMEPVIAHEMTHDCLGHLPLPLWLNEGLAVNTEHRVSNAGPPLFTPQEMHEKHLRFWGEAEVQEFWSGKSFDRHDDGNMLSYDLARILVDQFSSDWKRFQAFVNAASFHDAGAAAAREELGLDLGAVIAALLERDDGISLAPKTEQ